MTRGRAESRYDHKCKRKRRRRRARVRQSPRGVHKAPRIPRRDAYIRSNAIPQTKERDTDTNKKGKENLRMPTGCRIGKLPQIRSAQLCFCRQQRRVWRRYWRTQYEVARLSLDTFVQVSNESMSFRLHQYIVVPTMTPWVYVVSRLLTQYWMMLLDKGG
ncbi:hypothetical protein F4775DRAFT_578913 [Biscogniauxia sp. FL1348]|nr:hypothetical protein F4775DRAFT_578913 [Biscogniauxia sp. FL1348]